MNRTDNQEKPSRYKQWQERSEKPIAARPMTKEEIEEHRHHLVQSYQCDDSDITYEFQKITDENDEDRDDCLWLKYKMKCVVAGKPIVRDIFSIKLPIPDDIRRMAAEVRKQQVGKTPMKKPTRVQTTQNGPLVEEIIDNPQANQPSARPKLRKPARCTKK